MSLRTRISLALALWFACEAIAFVLVVEAIGVGGAILLGIATSLLGASLLKRLGTSALTRLRRGGGGRFQAELAVDDTLAGIGALLLLLPGFATDVLGLLLAVPALRDRIGGWLRRGAAKRGPDRPGAKAAPSTIDLDPQDWRPVDTPRDAMPRG